MLAVACRVCPDLMMKGTQQFGKPVEGLELPADPNKVQPLQSETCPAIPGCTAGRKKQETVNTYKYC